ncbi:MAG: tRNA (adenosine(37)-N6)-threonylcarbamoyltransferase complex transferase subunit TsaD [Candidatus Omnitrophica bacterium 4484_171]|nr:MAG: tRNA (adenosine(37)-N6)-threonylcarbamoyltransferase complex transferase subunit TsaD [Candidatus Omnitrophica bacterium 4484_171]
MYVLGIETSCDETGCAIVRGRNVLSNVIVSSLRFHKRYGGIIPEIATRNHAKVIDKVFKESVVRANLRLSEISAISVTCKPGLVGALVVGINFSKALTVALNKPLVGINHLHAHLFAPFLSNNARIPFPFLGLVVSGGHTELFVVRDFDRVRSIGKTRDDAAGEVFDKVARAFGLGYPGGVYIDKIFKYKYRKSFSFKCGRPASDFSFSGIKTALIYKKHELENKNVFSYDVKVKLLSSFEESVVSAIVENAVISAKKYNLRTIVCGGGVISNTRLRALLKQACNNNNIRLFLPPKRFCSDNAAMVAGLGFYLYNIKKIPSSLNIGAFSN